MLHFSEQEAYARITVARASRKHPMLLAMLRDGRLHLSGIVGLVPHLTLENRETVLKRATHKSKRQIEELVAELEPKAPTLPGQSWSVREARSGSIGTGGTRRAIPAGPRPCLRASGHLRYSLRNSRKAVDASAVGGRMGSNHIQPQPAWFGSPSG